LSAGFYFYPDPLTELTSLPRNPLAELKGTLCDREGSEGKEGKAERERNSFKERQGKREGRA